MEQANSSRSRRVMPICNSSLRVDSDEYPQRHDRMGRQFHLTIQADDFTQSLLASEKERW